MKRYKNNVIVYLLLMQFFSLFSSDEYPRTYNDAPHVEMNGNNYQSARTTVDWGLSYHTVDLSHRSYMCRANYSTVAHTGSAELNKHFDTVIAPMMYDATINNYYCAVPGYLSPHGLRDYCMQPSQFVSSDTAVITALNQRIESYCTRIEDVVLSGKKGMLCDTISSAAQNELAKIYADFLKEFYPRHTTTIFYHQSQNNPVMQRVMSTINWHFYDGKNRSARNKKIEQRYAASINGKLGVVLKALHAGDSEKAYTVGQQRVTTVVAKTVCGKALSVFDKYPHLHKIVEDAYCADKARAECKRVAQETAVQQTVVELHKEYKTYIDDKMWGLHVDTLMQRCNEALRDIMYVRLYQKLHNVAPFLVPSIGSQHLTADKKGILFFGSHLQQHLVDEAISVIDVVISQDLIGNLGEAVVDLANTSLTSNKSGDIVTASRTLDACWMIIDFTHKAARYAHQSLSCNLPIVAAMVDGVDESLCGTVHALAHPIETAVDVVHSCATMGYFLGRVVYVAAEYEGIADLAETHPHVAAAMIHDRAAQPSILPVLCAHAKTITKEDAARVGTKTVVDMMLLHGVTKVISAIAKAAVPPFLSCMRKGSQSVEVAITAEGVPVSCAEEVSALMDNLQNVGGGAAVVEAAMKIAREAPEFLRTFEIAKYDPSIGNLKKLEEAIEKLKNIPGALTKDGPLFKALKFGQKAEVLTDPIEIAQINARLSTARGAMYEVEKAIELVSAGEGILELGGKIGNREFDIVTKTKLIECKNIDWAQRVGKMAAKTRSDFGDYNHIAQQEGKVFELHSKNFIPKIWKDWLIEKGINFIEDNFYEHFI